jgi:hemerythrin
MSDVSWDPSLETGDSIVDGQHRDLMVLFNELRRAEEDGQGEGAVGGVLDRLSEYIMVHLEAERRLMTRTDFDPDEMRLHLAEHDHLTARTREMILQYRAGELNSILPLAAFLREWFYGHIRTWDRALVAHVRSLEDTTRVS